jgi:copper chaperone|tara:strand:+ start:701 stop:970 length:270 start_codon:yes stop_codon:yes gene_type:complete
MTAIEIENLKCGGCASTIKKRLSEIDGLNSVDVNLDSSEVILDTDNTELLILVKNKLSKLGYPEVGANNSVLKQAKSFVSCAIGRMNKE